MVQKNCRTLGVCKNVGIYIPVFFLSWYWGRTNVIKKNISRTKVTRTVMTCRKSQSMNSSRISIDIKKCHNKKFGQDICCHVYFMTIYCKLFSKDYPMRVEGVGLGNGNGQNFVCLFFSILNLVNVCYLTFT